MYEDFEGKIWDMKAGEVTAIKINDKVFRCEEEKTTEQQIIKETKTNMKRCKGCNELLPVKDFFKRERNRDGFSNYCKQCHNERYVFNKVNKSNKAITYDLGSKVTTINNDIIFEKPYNEFKTLLTDGEKHTRKELSKIIKKYFPAYGKTSLKTQVTRYLKALEKKNNLQKEFMEGSRIKKVYWIETKIIKYDSKKKEMKISDGSIPLKNVDSTDRKGVSDWYKFKIRGYKKV